MKKFIEEYGKIVVVIVLILLILGFGHTGFAPQLHKSILHSTEIISDAHKKFDNNSNKAEELKPGAIININGTHYIILEQPESNIAKVITAETIGAHRFQTSERTDGQNKNTYEGSDVDNYLENEWYKNLSSDIKSKIVTSNIKQASYAIYNDPESKQEQGYNGQTYNVINRHVFLPSIEEISKIVDFKNPEKVKAFLNGKTIWTRDSYQEYNFSAECVGTFGGLGVGSVTSNGGVRAVFAIDLTNLNYEIKGASNFK